MSLKLSMQLSALLSREPLGLQEIPLLPSRGLFLKEVEQSIKMAVLVRVAQYLTLGWHTGYVKYLSIGQAFSPPSW